MTGFGEGLTPSSGLDTGAFVDYLDYVLEVPHQPEPQDGGYVELEASTGGDFGPSFRRFTNYDESGYSHTIPLVSIN